MRMNFDAAWSEWNSKCFQFPLGFARSFRTLMIFPSACVKALIFSFRSDFLPTDAYGFMRSRLFIRTILWMPDKSLYTTDQRLEMSSFEFSSSVRGLSICFSSEYIIFVL